MSKDNMPVLMAEEYWANSMFSIARYYGGIQWNGKKYVVVNKFGETLFEISERMDKNGEDGKAIPPGEPADLVREDWIPIYKKLGREEFIKLIEKNVSLEDAKKQVGL